MTEPEVTYPVQAPGLSHVECAEGSRRDPDESLAQPCHVCGHFSCRRGPQGPVPCESCAILAYVRTVLGSNIASTVNLLEQLTGTTEKLTKTVLDLSGRIERASSFPI